MVGGPEAKRSGAGPANNTTLPLPGAGEHVRPVAAASVSAGLPPALVQAPPQLTVENQNALVVPLGVSKYPGRDPLRSRQKLQAAAVTQRFNSSHGSRTVQVTNRTSPGWRTCEMELSEVCYEATARWKSEKTISLRFASILLERERGRQTHPRVCPLADNYINRERVQGRTWPVTFHTSLVFPSLTVSRAGLRPVSLLCRKRL